MKKLTMWGYAPQTDISECRGYLKSLEDEGVVEDIKNISLSEESSMRFLDRSFSQKRRFIETFGKDKKFYKQLLANLQEYTDMYGFNMGVLNKSALEERLPVITERFPFFQFELYEVD